MNSLTRGFYTLLFLIVFEANVFAVDQSLADAAKANEKTCKDISAALDVMIETGLIKKYKNDWSTVQVGRDWYKYPFDTKGVLLHTIAACKAKGGLTKILDFYNGETVASATIFGEKVYK